MFSRFKPFTPRPVDPLLIGQDQSDAATMLNRIVAPFPVMKALVPPVAQNEDLEKLIYEAVERDLREAGYLP